MVETSERAIQLRVIVTTPDSGRGWDLRCKIREGLIDLTQREYPQFLPRLRTELDRPHKNDATLPDGSGSAPRPAADSSGAESAGTAADPVAGRSAS